MSHTGVQALSSSAKILEYGQASTATTVSWDGFTNAITCVPVMNLGRLPFADFSFDVALSPDYLFTDKVPQTLAFYLSVIHELARVAKEVRIYPLGDEQASRLLGPVLLALQQANYGVEVCLGEKDKALLRVFAQQCEVR